MALRHFTALTTYQPHQLNKIQIVWAFAVGDKNSYVLTKQRRVLDQNISQLQKSFS